MSLINNLLIFIYPVGFFLLNKSGMVYEFAISMLVIAIINILLNIKFYKGRVAFSLHLIMATVALIFLVHSDGMVLKLLPLANSIFFFTLFAVSNFEKETTVEYYTARFKRQALNDKLKVYLRKVNIFWSLLLSVNVVLQVIVLAGSDALWLFYTTTGCYLLFALGFIIEYTFRKVSPACGV